MYNGQITAVLNMLEDPILQKKSLNTITRICKENDLYAGMSNSFGNIIEISEYYKQALSAIELGSCTVDHQKLFFYEDHYLEHIKNVFVQKASSKTFCHPKMKLLLNYDQKHDSELAYTLYMYLVNERSIAATSVAMRMHRNSLVYRMKKINSLIAVNYESYPERQYLILSYEMAR
jgi:DNA-binding PucR family transcriptional regulator